MTGQQWWTLAASLGVVLLVVATLIQGWLIQDAHTELEWQQAEIMHLHGQVSTLLDLLDLEMEVEVEVDDGGSA